MKTTLGSALLFVLLGACAADDGEHFDALLEDDVSRAGDLVPRTPVQRIPAPLAGAHCTINVTGVGVIDMEEDYLPHVITCENGGANLEALKAQAIAARSVAYYAIETDGGICDSQGCQVYSCGNDPTPLSIQAVNETSGQYLSYNDTLTYAFFVAGDSSVSGPGCTGVDANAATEHWVTYNGGKTGTDVVQTQLGFVHDPGDNGYGQNRGCMGQWAARCLENDNGEGVTSILQFFYGDDIGIIQAQGACVLPLPGEETTGVVDPTTGGAGEDTSADESSGDDAGATTIPPPTTAGEDDSAGDDEGTAGGEDTTDKPDDGTDDGDAPGVLPETFGEVDGEGGGCGCTADSNASPIGALGVVVLLGLRRRRR